MIIFECRDCKTTVQVSEGQAGKAMSCPKCYHMLVVPGVALEAPTANDPSAPGTLGTAAGPQSTTPSKPIRSRAMFLVVIAGVLCVVLGTIGLLVVIGIGRVRESAARIVSKNNLKEIALGFHHFHDTNKRLPFNGGASERAGLQHSVVAQAGVPNSGSWGFQILPHVNQASMFQIADRTKPVAIYLCPGRGRPPVEISNGGGAWSDYFYNNYLNDPDHASDPAALDGRHHLGHVNKGDGVAYTVMIGHGNISTSGYASAQNVTLSGNVFVGGTSNTMRAGDNGIANPTGVTLSRDSSAAPGIGSWGGPFDAGALMAMCDASVRIFPYTTKNFGAFLTPSGKESVALPIE